MILNLCRSAALALLALALCCPTAIAANVKVTATGMNLFDPSSVTITQGDTVTWSNDGAHPHNVRFEEFAFVMPPDPFATNTWEVSNTFSQVGTYHYYCEVHGGPGGVGMSGTVTVNPAPAGGGGGGGGGGGPPGPPPPVDTAPVSSLVGPSKQPVGKLFVRASMNEAGTLSAAATVSVPGGAARLYHFKKARRAVSANVSVRLRLKLSKQALKKVRKALRKRTLRALIALTATDTTGNKTIRKLKVRLTR
jgi:plastocyanin